jgi:ParB-like chromosome segregation protein Spo0J
MKITKMNIEDLRTPERNIRIHTEKQIEEFVRSIKMFGQIRPVVIDENNTILAGNGLVMALKKAGISQVDVYRMEGLTENQKKKLMIADNKIFSLGIENLDTLNAFLEELGNDLDIPGFDEEILKSMVAEAEEVTEKLSQYGTLDEKEIESIRSNSAKKEALIENAGNTDNNSISDIQEDEVETADIKRYVICPKCGEQIWL